MKLVAVMSPRLVMPLLLLASMPLLLAVVIVIRPRLSLVMMLPSLTVRVVDLGPVTVMVQLSVVAEGEAQVCASTAALKSGAASSRVDAQNDDDIQDDGDIAWMGLDM